MNTFDSIAWLRMRRYFLVLILLNSFFLMKSNEPVKLKDEVYNQKRLGFLVGEAAVGMAVLGFIAKTIFKLCRPEIEKDVDRVVEKTIHDKKIDKIIEKEINKELKEITRTLSRNLLSELGGKLTEEERDTLYKYN